MIKFGTSGWRGIIARDFTFDNVRIATQGIADYLKQLSTFNSDKLRFREHATKSVSRASEAKAQSCAVPSAIGATYL